MKFDLYGVSLLAVVLLSGNELVAKAALMVEEPFNYGEVSNSLSALVGGTGFADAWPGQARIRKTRALIIFV